MQRFRGVNALYKQTKMWVYKGLKALSLLDGYGIRVTNEEEFHYEQCILRTKKHM